MQHNLRMRRHRLTLAGIRRTGQGLGSAKCRAFAGREVVIWSDQHGAWWRKDAAGYTDDISQAGVYQFEDAYARTSHCGPEKEISYQLHKETLLCFASATTSSTTASPSASSFR